MKRYFGFERVDVDKLACLKWIVEDFLPVDLQALPYIQRLPLIEKLLYYLYSGKLKELKPEEVLSYEKWQKSIGRKVKPQTNWVQKVGSFRVEDIISIDQLSSESFWKTVIDIKKEISETFTKDVIPLIEGKREISWLPWKPQCDYCLTRSKDLIEIQLYCHPEEEVLYSQYLLYYLKEAASYHFWQILDGLLITALRKCQECHRLFVQAKGKARKFCSNKCMNRWHSRKRREADPEGYRAKQREIMRKRYEEKQKEKHGPNVKINRRRED